MFTHLRLALRRLAREKGYALLNVIGLAIGLAGCLLMLSYVREDLRWDSFHEKGERIYRLNQLQSGGLEVPQHVCWTMVPAAPLMPEELPGVEATTRYKPRRDPMLSHGEHRHTAEDAWYVDSTFFEIFSFPLKAGDPSRVLDRPDAIVLRDDAARALFGEADPVGRQLLLDGRREVTVTGVLGENPAGSHIRFRALLPMAALPLDYPEARLDHWGQNNLMTYVLLEEAVPQERVEAKLDTFFAAHRSIEGVDFYLQALGDLHLHSTHMKYDHNYGRSDVGSVLLAGAIALLLLGIAVVNYINLATARSLRRAREISLRKVVGASRRQLALQLLGESLLLVVASMAVAVLAVELLEPLFAELSGRSVDFRPLDPAFGLPLIFGLTLGVTLLAGFYPAFVMSGHRPVASLRGGRSTTGGGSNLRRVLVVAQFAATAVLLVTSGVVLRQLAYTQEKKLGFDKEHVLRIHSLGPRFWEDAERYRDLFAQVPGVKSATLTSGQPGLGGGQTTIYPQGMEEGLMAGYLTADHASFETFGFEMAEGRWFLPDSEAEIFRSGDSTGAVVINETFARQLGWAEPVGKRIKAGSENSLTVVGVVRDYHFTDLRQAIEPVIIFNGDFWRSNFTLRFEAGALPGLLADLERRWNELFPERPFEYGFLDESFERLYRTEMRLANLLKVFAGLGIAVASLGLVGLAAHSTGRRRREMGVRKVLGAGEGQILLLLSREFLLLVLAANLIAWPLAGWLSQRWLNNFAYHTTLPWWLFPAAAAATLVVAWVAIAWQALSAARTDPARVLRSE